jgi:TRAP-type C4-dicarboxylate transport system permease small subunit
MEVIEIMLVAVVFFSVAYCGVKKAHVSIDVLISRFPPRARATIDVIIYLFGLLLFGFMAWGSFVSAMKDWDTHHVTGLLHVPIYPFAFAVAFGSLLLALVLLMQLFNIITNRVSK